MLIHNNKYLYLEMPKTGTTSVAYILQKLYGHYETRCLNPNSKKQDVFGKKHKLPHEIANATPLVKDLTRWITIRDPWSWYLSLYTYTKNKLRKRDRKLLFKTYGDSEVASFKEVLRGWTISCSEIKNTHIPHPVLNPNIQSKAGGYFSCSFRYFAHPDNSQEKPIDFIIDMNQMYTGLSELTGIKAGALRDLAKTKNKSSYQKNPRSYYDQEMIDWVYDADNLLINLFEMKPFEQLPDYRVDLKWNGSGKLMKK